MHASFAALRNDNRYRRPHSEAHLPANLAAHAIERFAGASEVFRHGEGNLILLRSSATIALLLKDITEQVMSLERRCLLDGVRCEIAAQELRREWQVAIGAQQRGGGIDQDFRLVHGRGSRVLQSILHFVETACLAVEAGEVQPRIGSAMTRIDRARYSFSACRCLYFSRRVEHSPSELLRDSSW